MVDAALPAAGDAADEFEISMIYKEAERIWKIQHIDHVT
jgi:hypothetical protein